MANEKRMDCVILGLLNHEPLTGYEIKKRVDTALKFFWSASYGSIYPTLNGLVVDKKVSKFETKENGRQKIIYTITEEGRDFIKEWLRLPVEKDEIRYETLLKLFFGSGAGKQQTLKHIVNFEEKIKKELPCLQSAVKQLEQVKNTEAAHIYYLLTAKFGVKAFEAYLEWCADAKSILETDNEKSN